MDKTVFEAKLNKIYGGNVVAVNQYINAKATLIHKCNKCNKQFYAKPINLVNGVQPHNCKDTGISKGIDYTNRRKKIPKDINIDGDKLVKELDKLLDQGANPYAIRTKTGIDLQIIKYYRDHLYKNKQEGFRN